MTDEDPQRPQPSPWSREGPLGPQWFGAILVAIGVVLLVVALVQWQGNDNEKPRGTTRASEEADRTDQVVLALIGAAVTATGAVLIVKNARDGDE